MNEKEIKNYVLTMLGAPVVSIELDESAVKTIINEAKDRVMEAFGKDFDSENLAQKLLIKDGAYAMAKTILARIRGKYKDPPGSRLDGDVLAKEAFAELKEWDKKLKKIREQ